MQAFIVNRMPETESFLILLYQTYALICKNINPLKWQTVC